MKEEYQDFIGIFDGSVPLDLCNEFVKNYQIAKENRTFIDLSKESKIGWVEQQYTFIKRDETAIVTPVVASQLPFPDVKGYFEFLRKCYVCYKEKYSIEFGGPIFNDIFKIHKVRKSEGFHQWHHERAKPEHVERLLAYMTYLEVPTKGGETEFLHQSLRVDPVVGRTLIWPAGFTHMHRGNPPLEGEKMYITGWFTSPRVDLS
jgi:hypothetical protein